MGARELIQEQRTELRPDDSIAPPVSDSRRWLALSILLIGAFLPPLDYFVVNVALPSLRQGLRAGEGSLQFVMSGYSGAYAVLLVLGGRLGDLYGRRRMFMIGMAGFALASGFCGLAWTPAALVAGRVLQGASAAVLAPQVVALIHVLFPSEEKVRALGWYGATFGLAGMVGQVLAGALIRADILGLGWRTIFLINLPVAAAALVLAIPCLQESRKPQDKRQRLDVMGAVLLFAALATLVYPLVEGRQAGWPVWCFAIMVFCPVLLVIFWQLESALAQRGGDPLLDPALFRAPGFKLGLGATLMFYLVSSFFYRFQFIFKTGSTTAPFARAWRSCHLGWVFLLAR